MVVSPAPRLQPGGIRGIGKKDLNIGFAGEQAKCLIGGPALPGLGRTGKIPGDDSDLEHFYPAFPTRSAVSGSGAHLAVFPAME